MLTLRLLATAGLLATSLPMVATTTEGETAFRAAVAQMPFQPGERLIYKVKWGLFTVGEVTLEVAGPAEIDGRLALHYTFTARTTGLAERLFRVRDVVHSYFDPVAGEALLYLKEQQEGDDHRSIVVAFDHEGDHAVYSNYGIPVDPVAIVDGTHCPLSILYASRLAPNIPDGAMAVPVSNGKRLMEIRFPGGEADEVRVGAGRYETRRIDAEIVNGDGDFAAHDDNAENYARLWLTKDTRRLPVMFETRLKAGTFRAKLEREEWSPTAVEAWAAFEASAVPALDG